MMRVPSVVMSVVMSVAIIAGAAGDRVRAQQTPGAVPTFKAGVDLVTVSVTVKNRDGKPVTGLSRQDFELTDAGHVRSISDFRSEPAPVSLAVLLDTSGSMQSYL